ncbi:MAG: hypothetical protein A4E65_02874 [Syntrophorhabdus sp. PtaU1.Bin153]|nr:MAG: hypothetical protein A4E65_02874 [Syntrophorhabdus sp. PtaU1.Bin153]
MQVIGITPDLIVDTRRYLGRASFTGRTEPVDNERDRLSLWKGTKGIIDGALVERPLFVIEDIEEDSPATPYEKITHVSVTLNLGAQNALDLLRFPQFGDLLEFIENDMEPGRMFFDEFSEERKGLFEKLKAVYLSCRFSGDGNAHLGVRLDHGPPDADEPHGLLEKILVVVAIGVEVDSELVGHSLQVSYAKKINVDGNNALPPCHALNTLDQGGLAVAAGRIEYDIGKIQGMRGKFLHFYNPVAERFFYGEFLQGEGVPNVTHIDSIL